VTLPGKKNPRDGAVRKSAMEKIRYYGGKRGKKEREKRKRGGRGEKKEKKKGKKKEKGREGGGGERGGGGGRGASWGVSLLPAAALQPTLSYGADIQIRVATSR